MRGSKDSPEKTRLPPPKKQGFGERPFLLSPVHLSTEPIPGCGSRSKLLRGFAPPLVFLLGCLSFFYLKQKVQSACLLTGRAWHRKGLSRQDRASIPSPPLLATRPQDGMHCTRSGPSSSSDVSEELGDSSESASGAPTPGSRQRCRNGKALLVTAPEGGQACSVLTLFQALQARGQQNVSSRADKNYESHGPQPCCDCGCDCAARLLQQGSGSRQQE